MRFKILVFIGFIIMFFIMLRIDSCMDAKTFEDLKKQSIIESLETEKPE